MTITLTRPRQKAMTFLALTALCRPSDIAPQTIFRRSQISQKPDSSLTLRFFGIKNDSQRQRFGRSQTAAGSWAGAGSWRLVDHGAPVMAPVLVCLASWGWGEGVQTKTYPGKFAFT
ncbi:hypothetical protein PoB_007328600 [Plakobranchus ocellatus]|uniref:Secreted protein n=1 Tax=Plakobranchus ocellatus TaxID=259542 RepID=A0AAV4DS97_9GAST|nr:hypothetical protein PoB_007328600 [Plakobranchus ocellatus]